jgi:(S)-ureidoglycine aminohydrolase
MTTLKYYSPQGGLPSQSELSKGRAIFTTCYALIPRGAMSDIVKSNLPFWEKTDAWILARPMTGFSETFSQYIVQVAPGGGSRHPEPDKEAEAVLFVTAGEIAISINAESHVLRAGGYAYVPPQTSWSVENRMNTLAAFHWVRKRYEVVNGIAIPKAIVTTDAETKPVSMPGTNDRWSTTRFVDPNDLSHDMHVNIVNFEPGAVIPFAETHVMEHGLYVLEGKAIYLLNRDWVEVEAGDFMWLRAFCPQACYAAGTGRFRYLLYKDVNRHPKLTLRSS